MLARAFRPLARSPLSDEVKPTAPRNFLRSPLSKVVLIIDVTEVEVERVWHKDAAYALFPIYKGKPTD